MAAHVILPDPGERIEPKRSKRNVPLLPATGAPTMGLGGFDRDGFAVVEGLISEGEVYQIRSAFMKASENGPVEGLSEMRQYSRGASPLTTVGVESIRCVDPLLNYPRMMQPHLHSHLRVGEIALKYMLDRRLHGALKAFMRDEPLAVQSMFYFKPPGARGQALHQDNFYLRIQPGTCMAAWIAIDDADQENGGMVCVPHTDKLPVVCPESSDTEKSFTSEHVEPPEGLQPLPVNLRAGDVLFFNGSVIHGSYPNRSPTRFRRSLIFHYVPIGTRQLSSWYSRPLGFDGTAYEVQQIDEGGPCGDIARVPH